MNLVTFLIIIIIISICSILIIHSQAPAIHMVIAGDTESPSDYNLSRRGGWLSRIGFNYSDYGIKSKEDAWWGKVCGNSMGPWEIFDGHEILANTNVNINKLTPGDIVVIRYFSEDSEEKGYKLRELIEIVNENELATLSYVKDENNRRLKPKESKLHPVENLVGVVMASFK